jgi:hypothetical protein
MTTIFFFFRSAENRRSRCASSCSLQFCRSTYSVVLGLGTATFRRLAGGGPSILAQTSPARLGFVGVALPEDGTVLKLGEGYRFDASRERGSAVGVGGDGELERADKGDDGIEERGEDEGDAACIALSIATVDAPKSVG